jgi:hypothetical protein
MPVDPDVYADGFSVSAGPFGLTLTLQLSDPSGIPGAEEASNVNVARFRLSRELARVMAEQIQDILTKSAQTPIQMSSEVKH